MAIISERLAGVIQTREDWYNDDEFTVIFNKFIPDKAEASASNFMEEKWELIGWFANALAQNLVKLGDVKQGFNDDDRKGKYAGPTARATDTIILHHTASKEEISLCYLP